MDFSKVKTYEKTDEQLSEIYPLVKNNFLTKNLEEAEIQKLIKAMKPEYFKKGDNIISYGDVGNKYYILADGTVKVIVYQKGTAYDDPDLDSKISFTKYMDQGNGFGELALLYNDKRSATIKATIKCTCYSLDSDVFKTVVIGSSIEKRAVRGKFLEQI
jgi:CRP-like cAMP-binding protein